MRYPLHRFQALAPLTLAEATILETLGGAAVRRKRGEVFQRQGDPSRGFHLLLSGWVASSISLHTGYRLIQKVHLPGDMLSTPSMILSVSADTLTALSEATTSFVPFERLKDLFTSFPRLAALFTMAVQAERLTLMESLAAIGTGSAKERVARLFLDFHSRLQKIDVIVDDAFEMPLTQEMIGDLVGLTNVHVNRTIRWFEHEGLIERKGPTGQWIRLMNIDSLRQLLPTLPHKLRLAPDWLPVSVHDTVAAFADDRCQG